MRHHITITYTNSDDGVWLVCSCFDWTMLTGWRHCLGYEPDVKQLLDAVMKHLENPDE